MSPAALRDVRRGPEPGALEFTLTDGTVLHAAAYGVHQQEQERVQAALLAALRSAGIQVR
jgi:hypothetical protein